MNSGRQVASGAAGLFFAHQAAAASICMRREGLPQRRALSSGDSAKTFKNFVSGDCFSSLGLSDRFQELRLKFRRNFKCFVRFASKDGDDRTFGQGIPFHDDHSAYDRSSG